LTAVEMTKLGLALGRLSGGPAASGLHVHPLTDDSPELPQVAEISSTKQAKGGGLRGVYDDRSQFASEAWHSDITFEKVPSSFVSLSSFSSHSAGRNRD
jgi:alpha-ketoglutarate-dependent taurine dioxygenase